MPRPKQADKFKKLPDRPGSHDRENLEPQEREMADRFDNEIVQQIVTTAIAPVSERVERMERLLREELTASVANLVATVKEMHKEQLHHREMQSHLHEMSTQLMKAIGDAAQATDLTSFQNDVDTQFSGTNSKVDDLKTYTASSEDLDNTHSDITNQIGAVLTKLTQYSPISVSIQQLAIHGLETQAINIPAALVAGAAASSGVIGKPATPADAPPAPAPGDGSAQNQVTAPQEAAGTGVPAAADGAPQPPPEQAIAQPASTGNGAPQQPPLQQAQNASLTPGLDAGKKDPAPALSDSLPLLLDSPTQKPQPAAKAEYGFDINFSPHGKLPDDAHVIVEMRDAGGKYLDSCLLEPHGRLQVSGKQGEERTFIPIINGKKFEGKKFTAELLNK